MTTRYGEEQRSGRWSYPVDVDGFLQALKTDRDHAAEARSRVMVFMMTPIARKMPPALRNALIQAGLLDRGARASGAGFPERH